MHFCVILYTLTYLDIGKFKKCNKICIYYVSEILVNKASQTYLSVHTSARHIRVNNRGIKYVNTVGLHTSVTYIIHKGLQGNN